MAIPIPFALSRVRMELKKAKATNITEIKHPTIIIIMPKLSGALMNNGIPAPIKKAKIIDSDNARNKLNHIFFLFIGWLNNNSINSEELYK
jgi:hypothetical protein